MAAWLEREHQRPAPREYFPRAPTSLGESDLDAVADELNDRPRKRLGFFKPIEKIADLLLQ